MNNFTNNNSCRKNVKTDERICSLPPETKGGLGSRSIRTTFYLSGDAESCILCL